MATELTDRVRNGSLADYGHFFAVYRRKALGYAYNLLHDSADAEEVVATAFENVLNILRRGLGPDDDGFWPYLRVTVQRCVCDLHRRRKLERLDDDDVLTQLADADVVAAVVEEQALSSHETTLRRAFNRLTNNHRLVLLLTEVEQQSPTKAAPLLELSPNATAALAYRARLRLRELYHEELPKGQQATSDTAAEAPAPT